MIDYLELSVKAAPLFVAAGVAWGVVKATMNGTKQRLSRLENFEHRVDDRLARIETKIDFLMEKK